MRITTGQCRAARSLLDWTQSQLSEAANVGLSTIRDFETGKRKPIQRNIEAIRAALEEAGIEFIDANGGGPGLRLRG